MFDVRYHSCERKRGYATEEEAIKICRRINKKKPKRYHVYKCLFEEHWHIGNHMKPSRLKRVKEMYNEKSSTE